MEILLNVKVGRARRVVEGGREYLVAPMTLIVPGVLNGSMGALYYPPDEVRKSAASWNGMPLTLRHPTDGGRNVSARHPGVADRLGLGEVRNARVTDNGKLKAEGWFEVGRTRRVAPGVHAALVRGLPIELSTGLFTDNLPATNGSTDPASGRPYAFVARNYRPDHVAILPDQTGACSLTDGCGVFNASTNHAEPTMTKAEAVAYLTTNCDCWKGDGDGETLNGLADAKVIGMAAREKELADNRSGGRCGHKAPAAKTPPAAKPGTTPPTDPDDEEEETMTGNMTTEAVMALLPDGLKQLIANADAINESVREHKTAYIGRITANLSGDDKAAAVRALDKINDLADLRAIAKGFPDKTAARGAGNPLSVANQFGFGPRVPNYAGAGVGDVSGGTDEDADLEKDAPPLGPTGNSSKDADDDPIRKKLRAFAG